MQNNGFHNDIFPYSWLLISPSPSLSVPHPILIFLVPFSLPDCPRYYFPGPCIQSYSLHLSKDSTPPSYDTLSSFMSPQHKLKQEHKFKHGYSFEVNPGPSVFLHLVCFVEHIHLSAPLTPLCILT